MDSEEDYLTCSTTEIGKLITKIRMMLKRPEIEADLGQYLDIFLTQLNTTQQYLSHGIFNVRFAEAALFLQSSVELYSKKVDLLWDNIVDYQMKLCSYNKPTPENTDEKTKILQRMRKSKRKAVLENMVAETESKTPAVTIDTIKEIEALINAPTYSILPQLQNRMLEICKKVQSEINLEEPSKPWMRKTNGFPGLDIFSDSNLEYEYEDAIEVFPKCAVSKYDGPVYNSNNEKVCNYLDSYLNCYIPTYPSTFVDSGLGEDLEDRALSTFLIKEKDEFVSFCKQELFNNFAQTYGKLTERDSEASLAERRRSLCPLSSTVKITRLPDELMKEFASNNTSSIKSIVKNLLVADNLPPARRNSEATTESILHDEGIADIELDDETVVKFYSSQRSSTDSGISFSQSSHNELPLTLNSCEDSINVLNNSHTIISETVITKSAITTVNQKLKRKLIDEDREENIKKRQRTPRFKWLKTTTTSLKKFERFFRKNYVPESDEGNVTSLSDEEDSDEETAIEENESEEDLYDDQEQSETTSLDPSDNSALEVDTAPRNKTKNTELNNNDIEETGKNNMEPIFTFTQSLFRSSAVVQEWKDFIEPKLEELERRPPFNIYDYGTSIMDKTPTDGTLNFGKFLEGQSSAEACRLFMASLQLANTNNVEVIHPCPGQLANDQLELRLLTKERYHEHLNEYEAPSENSFREKLAQVNALQQPSTSKKTYKSAVVQINIKRRKLF